MPDSPLDVQIPSPVNSRIISPETRAKMSAAHLGKGHAHLPETRAKISATLKGHKFTPEAIAKMSAALRGRKHSPEARAKMSAAHKGYKHSTKTRARFSSPEWIAAFKARINTPETRAKRIATITGRKHSAETRAKMSVALKGRPRPPEVVAKIAAAHTGRKCSPEHRASIKRFHVSNGHHSLTDIDPVCRTASCSICGLVVIRKTGETSWVCWVAGLGNSRRAKLKVAPVVLYRDQVLQMWKSQNGRCAICSCHIDLDRKSGCGACLDHDHVSGYIRRWLCARCNKGLGHFNDRPSVLRDAATYLENCAAADARLLAECAAHNHHPFIKNAVISAAPQVPTIQ